MVSRETVSAAVTLTMTPFKIPRPVKILALAVKTLAVSVMAAHNLHRLRRSPIGPLETFRSTLDFWLPKAAAGALSVNCQKV